MKKNNSIRLTYADRSFNICNAVFLGLVTLVILYPIIIVLSSSFSSPTALMTGKVMLFPVDFTLDGYIAVFRHEQIWTGLVNSCYYTIVGTVVQLAVTILAAYPLSRADLKYGTLITKIFAFTMWFNGGLMPTYLLIKDMGMVNSRAAMIIPLAMSVWNMVIVRTYFAGLPKELLESSQIDGCSDFKFLLKIAIPLSKPVIAVVTLYYAVANWNLFTQAYIYIQNIELQPIQVILRDILLMNSTQEIEIASEVAAKNEMMSELLKYSLVVVASLPMIIIYPFVQKYFVKGVMIGAIKG